MADVTGAISSLPGSGHKLPKGTMCDMHPDRPAAARVQGETDSFGSEMNDLCRECVEQERAWRRSAESRSGDCDWCKKPATDLREARDYDEGMYGPVYRVCGSCIARRDQRLREELDYQDSHYGCWECD